MSNSSDISRNFPSILVDSFVVVVVVASFSTHRNNDAYRRNIYLARVSHVRRQIPKLSHFDNLVHVIQIENSESMKPCRPILHRILWKERWPREGPIAEMKHIFFFNTLKTKQKKNKFNIHQLKRKIKRGLAFWDQMYDQMYVIDFFF